MENQTKKPLFTTKDLALTAICTVLLVLSAFITVPFVVPFTLQTFAIFLTLFFLGAKRGFFAILAYLLLGVAGLPVFSGFNGGIGVILGPTGGYVIGFLVVAIMHLIADILSKNNGKIRLVCAFMSVVMLHILGAVWMWCFGFVDSSFGALILTYVLPYFAMDLVKLVAAVYLAKLLSTRIANN